MVRHRAKVLERADLRRLLQFTERQRYSARNRVIVLLSFQAGLRACEIAGLDWSMVLATDGQISDQIAVSPHIAKAGSGRSIPMHRELAKALKQLNARSNCPKAGSVIRSERGGAMTPSSVVNWFSDTYGRLGLLGCSSHSGRRTFITAAARLLSQTGGSLRDVQELAGHRALTTTERYIQGDRAAQRKLIGLL